MIRRPIALRSSTRQKRSDGWRFDPTGTLTVRRSPEEDKHLTMSTDVPASTDEAPAVARLLVVDDMADTRRLVVSALSRQGFVVEEADSGAAALALVADHRPDLVLLDINMPGMSGLEVMTQLRHVHSLPVILLTGRDEENDRVLG